MAQPYKPPTKVKTVVVPFKSIVLRADPAFEAEKRKEPFYQFSRGRWFFENTANRGAYSNVPPDNP